MVHHPSLLTASWWTYNNCALRTVHKTYGLTSTNNYLFLRKVCEDSDSKSL